MLVNKEPTELVDGAELMIGKVIMKVKITSHDIE